jgi:hypothetical protein
LHSFLYGDLASGKAAQVEKHCASCTECRKELARLQRLRQALDTIPAPAVRVDLPRLYAEAARIQQQQVRRWRRAAVVLLGAAAVLLLAVSLKLELRMEAHQLVVRWGTAPAPVVSAPQPPDAKERVTASTISSEELQRMNDLIHALAAAGDTRDRRWQQEASALQARLAFLQERSQERDRVVAAMYSAQFIPRDKGEKR